MIVTHFDKNFYEWGKYYLISINKYNPQLQVYISGVNLKKFQIEELMGIHPKTYIKNHIIEFNGIQKRCDGGGKNAEWKIMMQCRVSKVILEAIQYAKDNDIKTLIVTNADMLLCKQINLQVYKNDIYLLENDEKHIKKKQILNGVIILNINKKTENFFIEYNKMNENRKLVWFDDQRYLYNCFNRYKEDIEISRLQKKYYVNTSYINDNDRGFEKERVFISFHSGTKEFCMNACKKYLNLLH